MARALLCAGLGLKGCIGRTGTGRHAGPGPRLLHGCAGNTRNATPHGWPCGWAAHTPHKASPSGVAQAHANFSLAPTGVQGVAPAGCLAAEAAQAVGIKTVDPTHLAAQGLRQHRRNHPFFAMIGQQTHRLLSIAQEHFHHPKAICAQATYKGIPNKMLNGKVSPKDRPR